MAVQTKIGFRTANSSLSWPEIPRFYLMKKAGFAFFFHYQVIINEGGDLNLCLEYSKSRLTSRNTTTQPFSCTPQHSVGRSLRIADNVHFDASHIPHCSARRCLRSICKYLLLFFHRYSSPVQWYSITLHIPCRVWYILPSCWHPSLECRHLHNSYKSKHTVDKYQYSFYSPDNFPLLMVFRNNNKIMQ